MKKKKKQFKDLKQLDRIEYHLAIEHYNKRYSLITISAIFLFLQWTFYILVLGILMYAHFDSFVLIKFLDIWWLLWKITIPIYIIIDIIQLIRKQDSIKKLNKKFGLG